MLFWVENMAFFSWKMAYAISINATMDFMRGKRHRQIYFIFNNKANTCLMFLTFYIILLLLLWPLHFPKTISVILYFWEEEKWEGDFDTQKCIKIRNIERSSPSLWHFLAHIFVLCQYPNFFRIVKAIFAFAGRVNNNSLRPSDTFDDSSLDVALLRWWIEVRLAPGYHFAQSDHLLTRISCSFEIRNVALLWVLIGEFFDFDCSWLDGRKWMRGLTSFLLFHVRFLLSVFNLSWGRRRPNKRKYHYFRIEL